MPGLSGARRTSAPESVTARLNFLSIAVGLVEHVDGALLGAAGRRHLARRVLEIHDPRADLGDPVLGHDERVAVAGVEALAMSRISSTCWRWSSPTGTSSAR